MSTSRRACVCVLLASAAALGGCATRSTYLQSIRANPTPELMTLHQRPVDVGNSLALMRNENTRMFWQDLSRALYWDRPSRLTPEAMPR